MHRKSAQVKICTFAAVRSSLQNLGSFIILYLFIYAWNIQGYSNIYHNKPFDIAHPLCLYFSRENVTHSYMTWIRCRRDVTVSRKTSCFAQVNIRAGLSKWIHVCKYMHAHRTPFHIYIPSVQFHLSHRHAIPGLEFDNTLTCLAFIFMLQSPSIYSVRTCCDEEV